MRDNFANYNEHQLRRMKATSPWFNDKLISDEQLEEMEMRLLEKATKPIRLGGGGGRRDDEAAAGEHRVLLGEIRIDPVRLFNEVATVVEASKRGQRGLARSAVLLHGIERGGVDHRALCQWSKLNETIDPFVQPIHYMIYTSQTTRREEQQQQSERVDQSTLLQNTLVASHFDPRVAKLDARHLVDQLEKQLDVSLSRVLLHRSLAVFLFEWFEAMPFCLLVACRLIFDDEHAVTAASKKKKKRRNDEDYDDEGEEETIGDFLESHTTVLSREEVLMFYDMTALEENDREKKKKVYRSEKQSGVEQLALDERQKREIKLVLRNTLVSYVTMGYARRD